MIKFDKPKNLNGEQLLDELAAIGIVLDKFTQPPFIDGDGDFWLDIDTKDTAKAQEVLDAHKPKPRPEPTVAEKLASVGLSLPDLKAALGL